MSQPRQSIGQLLIDQGLISEDQLRIALLEHGQTKQPVGRLLVSLGFISEATFRDALSKSLGQKSVDLAHAAVAPEALQRVPRDVALRYHLLPLDYTSRPQRLTLAIADPDNLVALDRLRALISPDLVIDARLAGESEIIRAIDRHYGHELSIDGILHEIETGEIDFQSLSGAMDEYSQPVVRLIDALLTDAVKREASDIHFEPEAGFLRIRYRIDGILRQIRVLHQSYWPAMAVRLKVMSGMNIAETRAAQDGRISRSIGGRAIDFRCAAQPTLHGENLVLRILDRQKGIVPLAELGLSDAQQAMLRRMLARPAGIMLVTGPTGSGKTTTLYSMLNHINDESINIMTLEDPVEYPMGMIRQTSMADAVKLDFANGIRSLMRQDPDVILVGEIRDADTAKMAFRAAMTGHLVFSTLHTNAALGVIPRLLDIGILPDILAGNIVGVIAQRLVRKLCHHCRKSYVATPEELSMLGAERFREPPVFYRPTGCPHCDYQGYRGRMAIMEVLPIDEDLDDLIARRAHPRKIREAAFQKGFQTLAEDGLRRVAEGITSLSEIMRVIDAGTLSKSTSHAASPL